MEKTPHPLTGGCSGEIVINKHQYNKHQWWRKGTKPERGHIADRHAYGKTTDIFGILTDPGRG
jgi:hypothetical protein